MNEIEGENNEESMDDFNLEFDIQKVNEDLKNCTNVEEQQAIIQTQHEKLREKYMVATRVHKKFDKLRGAFFVVRKYYTTCENSCVFLPELHENWKFFKQQTALISEKKRIISLDMTQVRNIKLKKFCVKPKGDININVNVNVNVNVNLVEEKKIELEQPQLITTDVFIPRSDFKKELVNQKKEERQIRATDDEYYRPTIPEPLPYDLKKINPDICYIYVGNMFTYQPIQECNYAYFTPNDRRMLYKKITGEEIQDGKVLSHLCVMMTKQNCLGLCLNPVHMTQATQNNNLGQIATDRELMRKLKFMFPERFNDDESFINQYALIMSKATGLDVSNK